MHQGSVSLIFHGIVLVFLSENFMASNKNISDIKDSDKDIKNLQQEEVTLDLPDVSDIPGQENIRVPDLKEMADTTISADDEEGVGLFADEDNDATSERIGSATTLNEDELIINNDEDAVEESLDEEDNEENEDDDLEITDDSVDEDSDVSDDEKIALERSEDTDTFDNEDAFNSELDDTDFDGEKLNEDVDLSGDDLDVPGTEDDDADEELGEEDEENNNYSLGDNR